MGDAVQTSGSPAGEAGGQQQESSGGSSGVQQQAGGQASEPKAPDLFSELGATLKKHGGLKLKSAGREVALDDPQAIVRRLQQADGMSSKLEELLKEREDVSRERELRQKLKETRDPRQRVQLLRELAGEGFDEAAEAAMVERMERERGLEKLSPDARRLQQQLEQERSERERLEGEAKQLKERQEFEATQTEARAIFQQIGQASVKALQSLGLKPESAGPFIPEMIRYCVKSSRMGLGLSEHDIAEHLAGQREEMNLGWLKGHSAESLFDKLEKAGLTKALLDEGAKRVRAKLAGAGSGPPPPAAPRQAAPAQKTANGEAKTSIQSTAFWNTMRER